MSKHTIPARVTCDECDFQEESTVEKVTHMAGRTCPNCSAVLITEDEAALAQRTQDLLDITVPPGVRFMPPGSETPEGYKHIGGIKVDTAPTRKQQAPEITFTTEGK